MKRQTEGASKSVLILVVTLAVAAFSYSLLLQCCSRCCYCSVLSPAVGGGASVVVAAVIVAVAVAVVVVVAVVDVLVAYHRIDATSLPRRTACVRCLCVLDDGCVWRFSDKRARTVVFGQGGPLEFRTGVLGRVHQGGRQ